MERSVNHEFHKKQILYEQKERNTDFFIEKIKEYPSFTEGELIEYIKQKRKYKSLFAVIGGYFFILIELLYKAVKTKGNNLGKTRAKLMDLKRINDSLIYVVQNPGFEELIKIKTMPNII